MNKSTEEHEEMRRSVETRRRRKAQWEREGERSFAESLAWVGSIGWLIVVPTLIGLFGGRWIDRAFDSGITWTAALLFLGVICGSYLAWKRMHIG